MPEENLDEKAEESSTLGTDEGAESSTVDTQEKVVEAAKEPPFHEHPRFKELITEKNELKEFNQKLQNQLLEITKAPAMSFQQKVEDKLYSANTPEEREFWQTVERVAESKIERVRQEERNRYEGEMKSLQSMVGRTLANDFMKNHPDVEKGSPEMEKIVVKAHKMAQTGAIDLHEALEDSYRAVMFDRVQEKAVAKHKEQIKVKTKEKEKANVETSTVPANSPVVRKFQDFDAAFDKTAKDLGITL